MNDNEFDLLQTFLRDQYFDLKECMDGKVADYIPQLAKNRQEKFGVSVCTVDGQTFNLGDHGDHFSIQSCSKPFMYCYARSLHGLKKVHSHVGYEPSGTSFNAFVLNHDLLPHNPMINAGAMMVTSLIHPRKEPAERFESILEKMNEIAGLGGEGEGEGEGGGEGVEGSAGGTETDHQILFDNSVYLSERHHADRNISLAYYMRGSGAYGDPKPTPSEIQDSLDLYFQTCSMEITCDIGSRMAGTLANGGINPVTGKEIFDVNTTRDCMSLMYSCGMYDYSGQFSFDVGLPAKSGVAGCVMLVVPGKFGMCVWSPPLDEIGNSVRGVELCRRLSNSGPGDYHMFRHIGKSKAGESNPDIAFALMMNHVLKGDVEKIEELLETVDVNKADYDGRTPLHIACAEGNYETVVLLMERGAHIHLRDRWNNTVLDDLNELIVASRGGTIVEDGGGADGTGGGGGVTMEAREATHLRILRYIDQCCEENPNLKRGHISRSSSKDSLDLSLNKSRSKSSGVFY
jgi:glutaminase